MKEKLIPILLLLILAAVVALSLPANLPARLVKSTSPLVDSHVQPAAIQIQQTPSGCDGGLYFTSIPAKCLGPDGLRIANEGQPQPFVRQYIPITPQP